MSLPQRKPEDLSPGPAAPLDKEAEAILRDDNDIRLSDRDRDAFLKALDSNDEPNEALKAAVEAYRKSVL